MGKEKAFKTLWNGFDDFSFVNIIKLPLTHWRMRTLPLASMNWKECGPEHSSGPPESTRSDWTVCSSIREPLRHSLPNRAKIRNPCSLSLPHSIQSACVPSKENVRSKSICEPLINQPINQSINQWNFLSINRPINQSIETSAFIVPTQSLVQMDGTYPSLHHVYERCGRCGVIIVRLTGDGDDAVVCVDSGHDIIVQWNGFLKLPCKPIYDPALVHGPRNTSSQLQQDNHYQNHSVLKEKDPSSSACGTRNRVCCNLVNQSINQSFY